MRQLLNTLFVTSEDIYLSLDGENVVANRGGEAVARYPLHTLQSIVSFSYAGASPALMGACAQREIGLAFCSPRGKFLARVAGQAQGNVLLRRMQYRVADDPSQSCRVAGMMRANLAAAARTRVIAVQSRLIRPRAEPRPPSLRGRLSIIQPLRPPGQGSPVFKIKAAPYPIPVVRGSRVLQ